MSYLSPWVGRSVAEDASSQPSTTNGHPSGLGSKATPKLGTFCAHGIRNPWSSCQCSATTMTELGARVYASVHVCYPSEPNYGIRLVHNCPVLL